MAVSEEVYCTLVLNDAYLPGASVLSHSLRDCGTTHKLACLVTLDTLSAGAIDELRTLYNYILPVPRLTNPSPGNLYLLDRADLLYAFTKINLWRQTQFRKIVYIDADVVALRAPEELFHIPDDFAAAPDIGWPDAFNTGVMVLSPDEGIYRALKAMATSGDSFDGADQGLINQYYENKPWKRLSFTYNCTPSASYQYEPAYRYHKSKISMVHFIGSQKPWMQRSSSPVHGGVYQELLSQWWAVYDRHHDSEPPARDGLASSHAVPPSQPPSRSNDVSQSTAAKKSRGSDKAARTFEPQFNEWDATRAPPPVQSKPEAANFPRQIYEFNASTGQFQPPSSYPEPPKNMWFEVPSSESRKPADKLPAIFPWEEREVPKPSRRFLEDEAESEVPTGAAVPGSDVEALDVSEFVVEADETSQMGTPTIKVTETAWEAYGPSNKNAWDEVSGIDSYVRALTSWQKTRGQVQVLQNDAPADELLQNTDLSNLADTVRERRESLILTDFPSAIERPSLPVTPAPRRRTTFWGDERDHEGNLPSAQGVPDQADWDPAEQLEQLRRTSLLGPEKLTLPSVKDIPDRADIPSATVNDNASGVADKHT